MKFVSLSIVQYLKLTSTSKSEIDLKHLWYISVSVPAVAFLTELCDMDLLNSRRLRTTHKQVC